MISAHDLLTAINSLRALDVGEEGELLTGVNAIAQFLGRTPRQVHRMLERGQLPMAFKMGIFWCIRKSRLRAYLGELERAAEAEAANTTELAA